MEAWSKWTWRHWLGWLQGTTASPRWKRSPRSTHAIRNEVSEEGAKKGRKPRETGKDDRDVLS
jgi:hypothetical protein